MLGQRGRNGATCQYSLPPERVDAAPVISESVQALQRRRDSSIGAKLVIGRAFRDVTQEYISSVTSTPTSMVSKWFNVAEDATPPLRMLLEVDEHEFARAIEELRVERRARGKGA